MRTYLNIGNDSIFDSVAYRSKADAIAAYERQAREYARYDDSEEGLTGRLHYANSFDDLVEYPDYVLSLGPRGGIRCERA